MPKRYRRTAIRVPGVRVTDDLVDRNFGATGPNQLWCVDIKYVRSWQGWLYLAAVTDCYSRRIDGWSMRPDLDAELVVDALEMAIARRRPAPGLVHHSDHNSIRLDSSLDYRSLIEYEKIMKEEKLPNRTVSTKPGAV